MPFGRRRIGSAHATRNSHVERSSASPVESRSAAAAVNLAAGRAAVAIATRALGRARDGLERVEPLESRRLLSAVISIEAVEPTAKEGSEYQFALFRITNAGDDGAWVTWTVQGGSASIGADLGQHPITMGGESYTIWVNAGSSEYASPAIVDDYYPEPTETFSISLSVPEQGVEVELVGDSAEGAIADDDVNIRAEQKTVTAGDEVEWGVWVTDYSGNAVSDVAIYVTGNEGAVEAVLAHDLTDGSGYAELGLRGIGLGAGYVTVRAYDDYRIDARSAPTSLRNKSAAPRINWIPQSIESGLQVSFDGLVKVGIELQKYDGSGPLRRAGLAIEWGMDHSGDYAERQADLGPYERSTDNFGRAYAYVDGNVVQRLFRDMDPTPTGSTTLWAKYPMTGTFKRVSVSSKAPVIDLRVASTTLHAGDPNGAMTNLDVQVTTPQGLPVMGSRIVVTTLEAQDAMLGFLFNSGGGGSWANTCFSGYTGADGKATIEARLGTFAGSGQGGTAYLVAQCAADTFYSWGNAAVVSIQIV